MSGDHADLMIPSGGFGRLAPGRLRPDEANPKPNPGTTRFGRSNPCLDSPASAFLTIKKGCIQAIRPLSCSSQPEVLFLLPPSADTIAPPPPRRPLWCFARTACRTQAPGQVNRAGRSLRQGEPASCDESAHLVLAGAPASREFAAPLVSAMKRTSGGLRAGAGGMTLAFRLVLPGLEVRTLGRD